MSNVNIAALLGLSQTKQEYASSESIYFKRAAGLYRIRLCPPWSDEGLPCRLIVQHNGYQTKDGQKRMPLCYQYAFTNDSALKGLHKQNVIKKEDLAAYGKIGCVYCRISDAKKQMDGKKQNDTYARGKYLWNILARDDNKVYVFNSGQGLLDTVNMILGLYPKLFDTKEGLDLTMNAVGEKLQRRYSYQPINAPCELGIETNLIHNLDGVMADGYTNIHTAIELIMATYPHMVQLLNLEKVTS